MPDNRTPGWDKKAVNRIAKEYYGGLRGLFDAHGWSTDGRVISQIAPTKVASAYGSISAFERAHERGRKGNALLDPFTTIKHKSPDVWLTSYYGFDPTNWGVLTFTYSSDRDKFIARSAPGALIVIYGTKDLDSDERGKILGINQVTHVVGSSENFMSSESWRQKQQENPKKWNYGVKCVRAWRVPVEHRPSVDKFASDTYSIADARTIGRRGKRMTRREAKKLLDLPLVEIPVFNGQPVDIMPPIEGRKAMAPSRPGPVSQLPHFSKEAEGPKHLYILRMNGKLQHFVKEPLAKRQIVKIGFSVSPDTRRAAFDAALPGEEICWEVHHSTFKAGRLPFPSSKPALAGEQAMKAYLDKVGKSLGREFFLCDDDTIDRAWRLGLEAAKKWKA